MLKNTQNYVTIRTKYEISHDFVSIYFVRIMANKFIILRLIVLGKS